MGIQIGDLPSTVLQSLLHEVPAEKDGQTVRIPMGDFAELIRTFTLGEGQPTDIVATLAAALGSATAVTVSASQASHGLLVGEAVEMGATNSWSTSFTYTDLARGIVTSVIDADNFVVTVFGPVSGVSITGSEAAGDKIYASSGTITVSTTTFWEMGICTGAGSLFVNPKLPAKGSSVVLRQVVSSGSSGGSAVAGTQLRDLNEKQSDPFSLVTLASGKPTFKPGRWHFRYRATAYRINGHHIYLRNETSSADIPNSEGSIQNASSAFAVSNESSGELSLALASDTEIGLYHWIEDARSTDGFGLGKSSGYEQCFAELIATYLGPNV